LPNEKAAGPAASVHDHFYRTRSEKSYGKSLGLAAPSPAPENTNNTYESEVDEPQSFKEAQQSKYADK
jgi:hypothetical protein